MIVESPCWRCANSCEFRDHSRSSFFNLLGVPLDQQEIKVKDLVELIWTDIICQTRGWINKSFTNSHAVLIFIK